MTGSDYRSDPPTPLRPTASPLTTRERTCPVRVAFEKRGVHRPHIWFHCSHDQQVNPLRQPHGVILSPIVYRCSGQTSRALLLLLLLPRPPEIYGEGEDEND